MKKALIGTTALVAGGLIAGSAMAADLIPAPAPEIIDDGFTVTWNGYIRSGFYAGDNDCTSGTPGVACVTGPGLGAAIVTPGTAVATAAGLTGLTVVTVAATAAPPGGVQAVSDNSTTVPVNGELQLFAEQTLANGLRVGGEIDFGIANATDGQVSIDELWVFVDGHFGQIRLGQKEGALDSLGGGALPSWGVFNGSTDGPDMNPLGAYKPAGLANNSLEDISGDANKVTYLSPTIAGINVGVSFTPDPNSEFGTGRTLALNGNAVNQFLNEVSVAANTTQTFGDTTIVIAGGFTTAEAEKNNTNFGDVTIWKVAGSIKSSFGGVGGWYSNREFDSINANGIVGTAGGTALETTTWGILGNIVSGDYTFGGGYTRVENENFSTPGTNFADTELDIIGFGVARSLGTGVEIGANATIEDLEVGFDRNVATTGREADGWLAGGYLGIAF